jgi:WD40 repeat protein
VLYAGEDDGSIIVWDIYTNDGENRSYSEKKQAHVAYDHANNIDKTQSVVQSLAVSEDGILASGGFDSKVILWQRGA